MELHYGKNFSKDLDAIHHEQIGTSLRILSPNPKDSKDFLHR
jgi:hypothetical protein